MADRLIYVAGNPDGYPLEYYDPGTECYQGVLPELLRRFAEESGWEVRYYEPGPEDHREDLARQQQVDLLSGCGTGEEFAHTEGELLAVLTAEEEGTSASYGFLCTEVAPEDLREELSSFLAEVSQETRTGLLLEATETVQPGAGTGLLPLTVGLGVLAALLLAVLAVGLLRSRHRRQQEREAGEVDALTGLGNLDALIRHLPAVVNDKNRALYHLIYFYVDLERLGRQAGQTGSRNFLRHMAVVLREFVGEQDLLARVSEGGFVLLRMAGGQESERLLLDAVLKRLRLGPDGEDAPYLAAGVAPLAREDRDLNELLFRAGQCARAAYAAGEGWRLCTPQELSRLQEEQRLREDVCRGLERQEFLLYIQFYVSVKDLRIVGGEALCRWEHPEKGFLTPDRFIPLLEREGLIETLDYAILEKVCTFLEELARGGVRDFMVSCNFSRKTFSSEDFLTRCGEILSRHAFPREMLVAELTESSLFRDQGQARKNAQALKDLGLRIALDDFGEGFTSFYDLLEYPVDGVKLDKSLVDNIGRPKGEAILKAMMQVGRDLGLTVLAEGVETDEQVRALREMGCDMIQGYRFFHPVPDWDARRQLLEREAGV